MFEELLSVAFAIVFCYIFLSLVAWCKAQNEAINREEELDLKQFENSSISDIDWGKPYVGWTDDQIESYEINHLRSDILG